MTCKSSQARGCDEYIRRLYQAQQQDGNEAFQYISTKGQQGGCLTVQPQYIGRARVAGALFSWVTEGQGLADNDGTGKRTCQIGENYQPCINDHKLIGMANLRPVKLFVMCRYLGSE